MRCGRGRPNICGRVRHHENDMLLSDLRRKRRTWRAARSQLPFGPGKPQQVRDHGGFPCACGERARAPASARAAACGQPLAFRAPSMVRLAQLVSSNMWVRWGRRAFLLGALKRRVVGAAPGSRQGAGSAETTEPPGVLVELTTASRATHGVGGAAHGVVGATPGGGSAEAPGESVEPLREGSAD